MSGSGSDKGIAMTDEPLESSGRDKRLEDVLAACVEALEQGAKPQELLARYREFAVEPAAFFGDRERLEQLAQPLRALAPAAAAADTTVGFGESVAAGPPPGTTVRYFGDYELLEEIARGGMGPASRRSWVPRNS